MSTFNWRAFLKNYSLEWLKQEAEALSDSVTPDMIKKGWLGYEPATDEQIFALETRIGKTLPPSYKDFLKTSNGWSMLTPFIDRVFSTQEVGWFKDLNAEWVNLFLEGMGYDFAQESFMDEVLNDLPERHLTDTLQISAEGDTAVLLLNPQVVNAEGEWQAWFFASWNPGATVYDSFLELIQAEYKTFVALLRKDKRRYQAGEDMRPKLSNLKQEIQERLLEREQLSVLDFGISDTARSVLHDVLKRVEAIQQTAHSSDEAILWLRELQKECAEKAKDTPPHVETTEMLAVLSPQDTQEMLNKINDLVPNLQAHGKQQGYQTALATINWFLRE